MKKLILRSLVCGLFLLTTVVLLPLAADATIINIPDDYTTIQEGIDSSSVGDTVRVARGTYYECTNFNGQNIVVASWFIDEGDTSYISSTIIDGSNSCTVVTFESGEGSTAQIMGFTIQNGWTTESGGGICCSGYSSPTISANTISGDTADYGGGIACVDSSNATISGNTISGNSAGPWGGISNGGGGIYCANSSPTISGNTISGNYANRYGGGIFCCPSSNPIISGNTISGNSVDDYGGGINCRYSSSPAIDGNTISGNSAGLDGGGIFCVGNSNATISDNSISNNSAGKGGGIFCSESSPAIRGNTISNNLASDGGGILCDYSSPAISDNIVSGNSAIFGISRTGGGILCGNNSNPPISNNTISNNSASDYGGGIYCNSSSPTVINTILWGDTAPNGPEIYVYSGNPIVTYSDVQDTLWPGEGNISCDPEFCYPDTGNYYLHANSCCVGAGQGGVDIGAFGVGCWDDTTLTLTIVPGDTVVAHNDTLCYHVICENHTPDYQSLSFKVNVRLPNRNMYGPIFGPARFGMFGNGISEGDMCHFVPPQAPVGDYWLFAEAYNLEVSARDSMAFTVIDSPKFATAESPFGDWQTVLARMGDQDLIGGGFKTGLPVQFALHSNYPNPFNASTVIRYQLPVASDVRLEVFNLLGEKVATLVDSKQQAGYGSVIWDASEVSSGLYFYKLTAGDYTETRRMMLVK